MPRLVSCLVIIICSCCISACYTPAQDYSFSNEEKIDKPKNVVWDKVIQYFAANDINIKSIDKNSNIIEGEKPADAEHADCGTSNYTPVLQREEEDSEERPMMEFNVYLKEEGKATLVSIHNRAGKTQAFQPMEGDSDVMCTSKGVLEKDLLDYVKK